MLETVATAFREEFADLSPPFELVRVSVRLMVAVALGAIVGYEREIRGSTAGLRTHMLVALGVALVIIAAQRSGFDRADMSRVLQGLFAGIGFLGAGAILKHSDKIEIRGLTTAASIWATAAIAATAGLGRGATALLATGLALVILALLLRLERRMARSRASPGIDADGPVAPSPANGASPTSAPSVRSAGDAVSPRSGSPPSA